jgi:uncharacterized protein (DUF1697 family)
MTRCIALIRGINVGKAKRLPMADLRELITQLGHTNVSTLLNSGNAIFDAKRANVDRIALTIQKGIEQRCGFSAAVVVLTAVDLDSIIEANPFAAAADDSSRFLIAFTASPANLIPAKPLLKQAWKPDAFAIGELSAYLWCASGILESALLKAFGRATKDSVTTRNWATVLKLQAAAKAG